MPELRQAQAGGGQDKPSVWRLLLARLGCFCNLRAAYAGWVSTRAAHELCKRRRQQAQSLPSLPLYSVVVSTAPIRTFAPARRKESCCSLSFWPASKASAKL